MSRQLVNKLVNQSINQLMNWSEFGQSTDPTNSKSNDQKRVNQLGRQRVNKFEQTTGQSTWADNGSINLGRQRVNQLGQTTDQ